MWVLHSCYNYLGTFPTRLDFRGPRDVKLPLFLYIRHLCRRYIKPQRFPVRVRLDFRPPRTLVTVSGTSSCKECVSGGSDKFTSQKGRLSERRAIFCGGCMGETILSDMHSKLSFNGILPVFHEYRSSLCPPRPVIVCQVTHSNTRT